MAINYQNLQEIVKKYSGTKESSGESVVKGTDHPSGCAFIRLVNAGANIQDQDFIASAKQDILDLVNEIAILKGWELQNRHDRASLVEVLGGERQNSSVSVIDTVSEFRTLRASVMSHWTKTHPTIAGQQLEKINRFHEAVDQAIADSLEQYVNVKAMKTQLLADTLLALPDPIYVLDLKGRFVYANNATADLFAMRSEAIIGKSTFDLGFSFASDFQRNLEKVVTDRSTYRGKLLHKFASGKGERFEYLLAPVLDENQNMEATVCITRNITEQTLDEEKIWNPALRAG